MMEGLSIKDYKKNWPLVKFESGKQILFFLKNMFSRSDYLNETNKVIYNPINSAIENFFGEIDHSKTIEFNVRDEKRKMLSAHRHNEKIGENVIVDKKPLKPYASFLRKSLQEKVTDIKDILAYSIILPDEHYQKMND